MIQPKFITAIGTPLTADDQLHVQGLDQHLTDQHQAGIAGRFAPRPFPDLDESQREKLFAQKTVAELCSQG